MDYLFVNYSCMQLKDYFSSVLEQIIAHTFVKEKIFMNKY